MRTDNINDLEIHQGSLQDMTRWLPLQFPTVLGRDFISTLMDAAPALAADARVVGRAPRRCSRNEQVSGTRWALHVVGQQPLHKNDIAVGIPGRAGAIRTGRAAVQLTCEAGGFPYHRDCAMRPQGHVWGWHHC